jgi:putative effector of murein hydrolase LrgA (UPF0299 family)
MDTTGFFMLLYFGSVIGVVIFLLILLSQFVKAHERFADAMEVFARKFHDNGK